MIGVRSDTNKLTRLSSVSEIVVGLFEADGPLLVGGCVAHDPAARLHAWSVLPWFAEPGRCVARLAAERLPCARP